MLKDLISSKNYLNNLFTEKDFNFIDSFDKELSEIDAKISNEEAIRNKILQFISSIADVLKLNDPEIDNYALYKLSNEVTNIFELTNSNINLLSNLKNQLSLLDSELVALLLDVGNANHTENYYKNNIQEIKLKIDDYSVLLKETNSKLNTNNLKINEFLSDSNTKKYLDGFNIIIDNYHYTETTTSTTTTSIRQTSVNDNNVLIISEKDRKVFLPYRVEEINAYLEQFSDQYNSFESVVAKEFILPLDYYMSHPVLARFREAYSLCRDREAKPIFESLKYGMDMMFNRRLNPAIIAACKTQDQLANYITCLEKNDLKNFTDFEIRFEMNPF